MPAAAAKGGQVGLARTLARSWWGRGREFPQCSGAGMLQSKATFESSSSCFRAESKRGVNCENPRGVHLHRLTSAISGAIIVDIGGEAAGTWERDERGVRGEERGERDG